MAARRLLITRPWEDAAPLAAALSRFGIASLIEPLLTIEPLAVPDLPLAGAQALLFTSANGVRAFAAATGERRLPVFTVGPGSAEVARSAGFMTVTSADGDVETLAALVGHCADPAAGHLLHAAGVDLAGDLAAHLQEKGFDCRRVALYRALPATTLSLVGRTALAERAIDGVVLFSPRTAEAFVRLIGAAGFAPKLVGVTAYTLSRPVAARIEGLPWRSVCIADRPDQEAMIALLTKGGQG